MKGFPTRSPAALEERPQAQQWMVDELWGRQAVGIIGGEPKCGKSFLALNLAVAVAAGVPCLRRFAADQPGPVLMFAAEDAGHIVRTRLQGIAQAAGADFETLDIAVIDVPTLRLDHRNDRQRLQETMERIEPRLLVLDPPGPPPRRRRERGRRYRTDPRLPARSPAPLRDRRPGLSTTPARVAPRGRARPCADPRSCTPGATATCTCAAATSRSS